MNEENVDKLKKIVLMVVIFYNIVKNVEGIVNMFGDIVGVKDKVKLFMVDFNKKVEVVKKKIVDVIDKDVIFGIYENMDKGEFWVFNDNGGCGG